MRHRIAEIHQQAIPEILRHLPTKVLDCLDTGRLVRTQYLAPFFGVELCRQAGRAHEVTKHNGQLAAFRGVSP